MTWQQELRLLKLESIKAEAPGFFVASGGYEMGLKPYSDKTTNGLTKCIKEFLELKGHYANRINTQGQARVSEIPRFDIFSQKIVSIGKNVTWTPSATAKGTPDIDAIINGRSFKCEIKVGRDKMSADQVKQKARIEKAGGLYFMAKDMESFYRWYYETFGEAKV